MYEKGPSCETHGSGGMGLVSRAVRPLFQIHFKKKVHLVSSDRRDGLAMKHTLSVDQKSRGLS